MRFHTFLLKYGEIGIKGKNRYLFEDALVRQVRYALKDVDGNFDVHKSQARIYVDCEGDYDYEDTGTFSIWFIITDTKLVHIIKRTALYWF